MKRTFGKKILTILSCAVLAVIIFIGTPALGLAYTAATGIVSADAAKVRQEPNTVSDVVASLLKGSTVTVTDEVTDSAGMTWYKVSVDNNSGYIRSDLLIKAATSAGTVTNTNTADSSKKPEPTTAKAIAETKAYVNYDSARVREGASTNHEIVGSATKNTPVIITGEASGSDGKKWYQIKYNNQAGREVTGFVRSDLLTIGDPPAAVEEAPAETEEPAESEAPAEEGETTEGEADPEGEEAAEEPPQEPAPEPVEKPDYEMVFTANNEGVEEWYLYDNINGTRQTLAGLFAAAEAGSAQTESDAKMLSTQKIIIIVLAVVAAILAVTVTLLLFKIKDLYDEDYEDYEDDEEEDDEEEEDDDEEEEEEIRVVRRKRSTAAPVKEAQEKKAKAPAREKTVTVKKVEYIPEEEDFEAGAPVTEKRQPKRKAKNFLVDDEFEFEFLNMDDKK